MTHRARSLVSKAASPGTRPPKPVTANALATSGNKRDRPEDETEERAARAARDAKLMRGMLLEDIFDPKVNLLEDLVDEIEDDDDEPIGLRQADPNIPILPMPVQRAPLAGTALLAVHSPGARPGKWKDILDKPATAHKYLSNSAPRTYGGKGFGMQQRSLQTVLPFSSPRRQQMPEGTVGLRNLGNFCYMNASLQAVMVFERLMQEVCEEARVRRVEAGMEGGKDPLCGVLRRFWLEARRASGQVLSAARIKAVIETSNAQFVGNDQEDAHEFFSTFINLLEDEYRETTKEKEGPVFRHFSLTIQHTLTCQECGQARVFEEPFLDLSLEHVASSEAVSVSVLLQHFMQTERDLEWKCPQACAGGRATLAHCMARSPRILLLQVKRFATSEDGRSFYKIKTPVEVPEFLDLSPVMQPDRAGGGYLYQLRAVVVHRGETIRGGHYVCFARKDEQWFRYNDALVDKCSSNDAFQGFEAQRDAYMLFYARMDDNDEVL